MLPLRALPCRALPCRALHLISEYSKPITRGDWRTFERDITTNVFIHEIDTLYKFENTCALFKLVHTNMHVNIDMCLYDMTQEELDAFINYKDDNLQILLYTIIMYIGNVGLSGYIGILLARLRFYFINNQPTNNVIINNFIYLNIWFGTLCSVYHIGYKMEPTKDSFYKVKSLFYN
jgi:hypothetical protein